MKLKGKPVIAKKGNEKIHMKTSTLISYLGVMETLKCAGFTCVEQHVKR